MKTRTLTFALLLSFTALSAFAQDYAGRPRPTPGHESSGGRPVPQGVQIEFGSRGNGIDSKSYVGVLKFVSENLRSGTIVKVLNKKWGREGESTLCLQFIGYSEGQFAAHWGYSMIEKIIQENGSRGHQKPTLQMLLECSDAVFTPDPDSSSND